MPGRGRLAPSLDHLFVAAFALLGLRVGSVAIGDNSALWHIRTGIDALAGRGIPRTDPYSWTAMGHPWVVQSWLVELAYGVAHRAGGFSAVVVLNAVVLAVVVGLMAALAATGHPRRTLLGAGVAVALAAGWWSPRPLLFGLVALGLIVVLSQRGAHPAWFALVGAVWVNAHGSFVLGAVWLALAVTGGLLDRRRPARAAPGRPREQGVRGDALALLWLVGGVIGGALVSPPGWPLLTFPAKALSRRDAFSTIVEWQRPDLLAGPVELFALAGLVTGAIVVAVTRPPLRLVVPAVAFAAAGLVSQRNMAAAGIALAPALGAGLRAWRPPTASDAGGSARVNRLIAAVIAAAAVVFVVQGARQPGLDVSDYPVEAVAWMDERGYRGPAERVAHTDVAGGWLILRDGRQARVFVDDRVDMYPRRVLGDYRTLLAGGAAALSVLERREVDVVLWPQGEGELLSVLRASEGWTKEFVADGWEVWRRRSP